MHYENVALLIYHEMDPNDARVYKGRVIKDGGAHWFINNEQDWKLHLTHEQLSEIQVLDQKSKLVFLDADYALLLTIMEMMETGPLRTDTGMQ